MTGGFRPRFYIIIILLGAVAGGLYYVFDYASANPSQSDDGRLIYAEPGQNIELSFDSGEAGLGGDWYSNDLAMEIEPESPKVVVEVSQSEDPSWGPYWNTTPTKRINVEGAVHIPTEYASLPVVYEGTLTGHIEDAVRSAGGWVLVTTPVTVTIELHVVSHEEFQSFWQGSKQQKLSLSKFLRNVGVGLLIGVIFAVGSAMPAGIGR